MLALIPVFALGLLPLYVCWLFVSAALLVMAREAWLMTRRP
jgi:hypothetical protein